MRCVSLIRLSASSWSTHCWQIKPERQRTYNVTPRRVRITTVAMQKRCYIFWVCVCSLCYPPRKSNACSALPYFFTLSHKRHSFRKNVIGHKRCILILPTIFVKNISHCKNNSARYHHKCTGPHVKCPLILSKSNETWIFSPNFQTILKYQISWRSVQWQPSYSTRTDGQTWRS
jgi:hypothetical protein